MRVALGSRAPCADFNPVMLFDPLSRSTKGFFGSEVDNRALELARTASRLDLMFQTERVGQNAPPAYSPDLFLDLDRPEDRLPLEFFLACLTACGVDLRSWAEESV